MKGQYVADIKVGDEIREVFLLSRKVIREKKGGGYFLTLEISDRTGGIEGVIWENAEELNRKVKIGDFIFITGIVNEYNGRPQIVVQNINSVAEKDIDPTDFLPTTEYNTDDLYIELVKFTEHIKNPHLRLLFSRFFPENPKTVEEKNFVSNLKKTPAAMKAHHARIGGLLEHTLTTIKIALALSQVYTKTDKDLLLVGTALHDIGKTQEYSCKNRFVTSDTGKLLGHILISYDMVKEQIHKIKDFPEELANRVLHMVISHHGEFEWGSPTKPKFLEALILHFIDNLDSKVEMILETIKRETDSETGWSDYHPFLEREIYLRDSG